MKYNRKSRTQKQEKSPTKRLVAEDCVKQLHLVVGRKAGEVVALYYLNPYCFLSLLFIVLFSCNMNVVYPGRAIRP
jgi:hypothetical protein